MKLLIIVLLFLLCSFLITTTSIAQTSPNCSAAGYCGNPLVHTGMSAGNANLAYGIPLRLSGGVNTITDIKADLVNTGASKHFIAYLVCDSNRSGNTIRNSRP